MQGIISYQNYDKANSRIEYLDYSNYFAQLMGHDIICANAICVKSSILLLPVCRTTPSGHHLLMMVSIFQYTLSFRSYSFGFTPDMWYLAGTTVGAVQASCEILSHRRPLASARVTGKSVIGCRQPYETLNVIGIVSLAMKSNRAHTSILIFMNPAVSSIPKSH